MSVHQRAKEKLLKAKSSRTMAAQIAHIKAECKREQIQQDQLDREQIQQAKNIQQEKVVPTKRAQQKLQVNQKLKKNMKKFRISQSKNRQSMYLNKNRPSINSNRPNMNKNVNPRSGPGNHSATEGVKLEIPEGPIRKRRKRKRASQQNVQS